MIDSLPTPKQAVIQMVQEMPDTATYDDILMEANSLYYEYELQKNAPPKLEASEILDREFLNYSDAESNMIVSNIAMYIGYKEHNKLELTPVQREFISLIGFDGIVQAKGFPELYSYKWFYKEIEPAFQHLHKIHSESADVLKSIHAIVKKYEAELLKKEIPSALQGNSLDAQKLRELEKRWNDLLQEREASAYQYFRANKAGFELEKMKEYLETLQSKK